MSLIKETVSEEEKLDFYVYALRVIGAYVYQSSN